MSRKGQASLSKLSQELGINPKTVAKWRKRATVADLKTGPRKPRSTVLTEAEKAVIAAFRNRTLLPLDDCLYALQPSIPHLTRSALNRCLQRNGISRLPDVEGDTPKRQRFKRYPIHGMRGDLQSQIACMAVIERVNRTIKEATVKCFHYENHDQLRTHLADFMAAYTFARRLKTLSGLTSYEYICKIWTSESDRSTKCQD
jgi:transposase-like protein